jgi:predicted acetyltransferase
MDIRDYDAARDFDAVKRIWFEVGWLDDERYAPALRDFLSVGSCVTACLDGEAECAVHTVPGTIRHLHRVLPLCAVTAVTTSRVARRQGFARRLTALQLARAVDDGAEVAALGMFDQGFYDKVGFGTGGYEHQFTFDPASLRVAPEFRVPKRLSAEHWRDIHGAMVGRLAQHGACSLTPPEISKAELCFTEHGYGLGYYDGDALSHFLWFDVRGQHGPYVVNAYAYRTTDELLELLALLRSLADQVSSVKMMEPPHLQLQDLLEQPFRHRRNTRLSEHGNQHQAMAWWQLRLLSLAPLAAYEVSGVPVSFNLELEDPIAGELPDERWQGLGGSYRVALGRRSVVVPGSAAALPTLRASVNALSRLFFGVASASALAVTDDFHAPAELLEHLDVAFRLPQPRPGWDF